MAVSNRSIINLGVSEIQAENIGAGNGVFAQKVSGNTLQFKTLLAGSGINVINNADTLTLQTTAALTPSFGDRGTVQLNDGNNAFSGDTGLTYNFSGQTLELNNLKFNNQPSIDEEGRYLLVYDPVTGLIKTFDTMATERIERASLFTDTSDFPLYGIFTGNTIQITGSSNYFISKFVVGIDRDNIDSFIDNSSNDKKFTNGTTTFSGLTPDIQNSFIGISGITGKIKITGFVDIENYIDLAPFTGTCVLYRGTNPENIENLYVLNSVSGSSLPNINNDGSSNVRLNVEYEGLHINENEKYFLGFNVIHNTFNIFDGVDSVIAASTTNIPNPTLSGSLPSPFILDGVTINNGDSVLLKDQNIPNENRTYTYSQSNNRLNSATTANRRLIEVNFGSSNQGKRFVFLENKNPNFNIPKLVELSQTANNEDIFLVSLNYSTLNIEITDIVESI